MKQFACANVVDGCDGVVTGETEDEVMVAVGQHAADAHGITDISDDLAQQVRMGIVEV